MAVVSVLVKWAAKDKLMNHLLRTLLFYAACYKFYLSVKPGAWGVECSSRSLVSR